MSRFSAQVIIQTRLFQGLFYRWGVTTLLMTLVTLALAACTITFPFPSVPAPADPSPTATPVPPPVDDFVARLMLALIERKYDDLQPMMGNPFSIGYWRSEGTELPPGVAIAQLRTTYLAPSAALAFDTTTDLSALLDGMDPLAMWGPDVNAVKAIYVTGLGLERNDEAILIVALDQGGAPYWHGMLAAAGGFDQGEPSPPATLTSIATATATAQPPPTATLPATGIFPTEVRFIRVLQNVNVRSGPGTQFGRIGRYETGQVIDVFGVNSNGTWWNVRCPNGSVGNCWVTAERDTTLPTTPPGPTPTNTPTAVPPPGEPVRIQFPPGAISTSVRGTVQFSMQQQYLLRALADQEMTVEIYSPTGLANFAIQGVTDRRVYKRLDDENRSVIFRLTLTQDYLITVATRGGLTNYELRVTVISPEPPPPPPPDDPIRIQFPPGGTSASVNGLVRPPQQLRYVLRALAGQEMAVQIASPGSLANFAITGVSDGQPYKRLVNEDRFFAFTLPMTQDYLITVASAAGAVDFNLSVSVVTPGPPPPPPDNPPIRINFAPGGTSATVDGGLVAGERQDYLLGAAAGQEMTVELYAAAPDTLLAISGADGAVYKRGSVGGPTFSFTLPATQDYRISVIADGGATNYTLVVSIY